MKKLIFSLALLPALFFSCASDDDTNTEVETPEETITDVEVLLTSDSGDVALLFEDEDAIGLGEAGTYSMEGTLLANTTYTGSFEIANALAEEEEEEEHEEEEEGEHAHGEDVTEEIEALAEEHQFFFEASEGLDLTVTYDDLDDNGYPVGLSFTLVTGEVSTGDLTITLRHEPNKDAEGVSDGLIENEDEGETDFSLDFPVTITEL